MNSQPLVSVIIVFLNAAQFIEEAIESVLAQTYDNWELLLVDDGSEDTSTQIALQYAKRFSGKIRYCEHEGHQNLGISAARNLGINNGKGEYIAFLDADDVWLPQKLTQQVAVLESHPEAAMVYGPAQFWNSWHGSSDRPDRDHIQKLRVQPDTLIKPPMLLMHFLQNPGATPCTCSILVRHKIIRDVAAFEEIFRSMYEDQAFYAKVSLKANIFVSSECLSKYRIHLASCCSVATDGRTNRYARFMFLKWIELYLTRQEVKDPGIWRVLKTQLWIYRHPVILHLLEEAFYRMKNMKRGIASAAFRILSISVRGWRTFP
jgi:glycosyltransferase involved in cell wall biosynthesis